METRNRRSRRLPQPRVQLHIVGAFLAAALIVVLVQALVMLHMLTGLAAELPNEGGLIVRDAPGIVGRSLLVGVGLTVPAMLVIGVRATFRVAGPLYRFETFLRQLAKGENPGPCRLRHGDELQELCELLNVVTAPLREPDEAPGEGGGAQNAPPADRDARSVA